MGRTSHVIASTIQRQVPLGSRVTVFRRDGPQVRGILSEIGRDHVTIEDNSRQITVLLDVVTGWEITNADTRRRPEPDLNPPSTSGVAISTRQNDGIDISKIMIEVDARFRAQLETATIRVSPPNFDSRLPVDLAESARVAWGRIADRYREAVRINELSAKFGRIQPVIRELEMLSAAQPDSATVHSHLAYLYTLSDDERARTHYRKAAFIVDAPIHWLNFSAASLSDTAEVACYGLRRYFGHTPATENISAWYVFMRLVIRFSAYRDLAECVRSNRSMPDSAARLIGETIVFLLNTSDDHTTAAQVATQWLTSNRSDTNTIVPSPSIDEAAGALLQIDRSPTDEYSRVVTYLDACMAQYNRRTPNLTTVSVNRPAISESDNNPARLRTRRSWEQVYREAALAQSEGRTQQARKLFQSAIAKGGGSQVYETFFKMEWSVGDKQRAHSIIRKAIDLFPDNANLYVQYGQSVRRSRRYEAAAEIFRQGMSRQPNSTSLRMALAQTLVQIGSEDSLQEVGHMFRSLDEEGKLQKGNLLYRRFMRLQRNPRVVRALEFFQAASMRADLTRHGRSHNVDIVVDVEQAELNELFGLSGSFLVRCFESAPSPQQIRELTRYVRSGGSEGDLVLSTGRRVAISETLAFISVPNTRAVHDQVMRILSDNQAAIIPLGDAFFQNRVDPSQAIQDVLAQYLGRRNLYDSTQPVSGRRFFGREHLLVQLEDALHSGQFVGVYGLRKIGKTSLVYQLRDKQLRHDAVAYVDLQASIALSTRNCAALYWEVERDLYNRLIGDNPSLADVLRLGRVDRFSSLPDAGTEAPAIFAEDLRTLLDAIVADRAGNVRRIVILLDELERILPLANQPRVDGYLEFFGFLRGLAQTERYRGILACVVVAANAAISERGYWEGRENPVFALYKPFFIPPLPENECYAMIRSLGRGMTVYWDRDATSAVFAETGGHPFLTRMLCSYLTQHQERRPLQVTRRMVEDHVGPFLRDQGNIMEQITELLTTHFPSEARVLEQIAIEDEPPPVTDEELRHLMNYHLIAGDRGGYRVTLNLLHRWLRRRAGLRK